LNARKTIRNLGEFVGVVRDGGCEVLEIDLLIWRLVNALT